MKYENCLQIPAGAKFAVRTGAAGGYIVHAEPNTIVQRTEMSYMDDENSVRFAVISGGMVDAFGDEHALGEQHSFLGLEDLYMEVAE